MLNQLYTNRRTGNSDSTSASRTDFQRDFDRIIFSVLFLEKKKALISECFFGSINYSLISFFSFPLRKS